MITRCKFSCQVVRKTFAREGDSGKFVYEAEFSAVCTGSKENEEFFKWTPSGSLKIGVYKEDVFQPGKDYYIDISEA
jgi:hypothetical protein